MARKGLAIKFIKTLSNLTHVGTLFVARLKLYSQPLFHTNPKTSSPSLTHES